MDSAQLDVAEPASKRQGLKFRKESIDWAKIRLNIAWPMIVILAGGSIALWWGAIVGLTTTGGFAGIASWQILGIGMLFYQAFKTCRRVTERNKGMLVLPREVRRRLWVILLIITCNIAANSVVIVLILNNLSHGKLEWVMQDTVSLELAALVGAYVIIWKGTKVFRSEAAIFFLVLGTRVVPQAALAFSPDLAVIPWSVLIGLGMMAGQRFVVSSIEYTTARSSYARGDTDITTASVVDARWIWFGDLGNVCAAVVPIGASLLL